MCNKKIMVQIIFVAFLLYLTKPYAQTLLGKFFRHGCHQEHHDTKNIYLCYIYSSAKRDHDRHGYKTVYLQDQTSITRLKESAMAKNSSLTDLHADSGAWAFKVYSLPSLAQHTATLCRRNDGLSTRNSSL